MLRTFETIVDPFRPHDDSMPPNTLLAFYWRYTRQVGWPLIGLLAAGFVVALVEVALYNYVGSIVDLLQTTSPGNLIRDYGLAVSCISSGVLLTDTRLEGLAAAPLTVTRPSSNQGRTRLRATSRRRAR